MLVSLLGRRPNFSLLLVIENYITSDVFYVLRPIFPEFYPEKCHYVTNETRTNVDPRAILLYYLPDVNLHSWVWYDKVITVV